MTPDRVFFTVLCANSPHAIFLHLHLTHCSLPTPSVTASDFRVWVSFTGSKYVHPLPSIVCRYIQIGRNSQPPRIMRKKDKTHPTFSTSDSSMQPRYTPATFTRHKRKSQCQAHFILSPSTTPNTFINYWDHTVLLLGCIHAAQKVCCLKAFAWWLACLPSSSL